MSFLTEVIMHDPRYNSPEPCRDLSLLEPYTRSAVQGIISDAKAMGIKLEVTETFRSQARQELLFAGHKTKLKKVGTHGFGLAADFCKVINGTASWAGDWTFMVGLAKKHGMVSGVDWGLPGEPNDFQDSDHVQRCSLADQDRIFSGEFYPDDSYSPYSNSKGTNQ